MQTGISVGYGGVLTVTGAEVIARTEKAVLVVPIKMDAEVVRVRPPLWVPLSVILIKGTWFDGKQFVENIAFTLPRWFAQKTDVMVWVNEVVKYYERRPDVRGKSFASPARLDVAAMEWRNSSISADALVTATEKIMQDIAGTKPQKKHTVRVAATGSKFEVEL